MKEDTNKRFADAASAAQQLISDGYTDVSVKMSTFQPSTIVLNSIAGDPAVDLVKRKVAPVEVEIQLAATKKF